MLNRLAGYWAASRDEAVVDAPPEPDEILSGDDTAEESWVGRNWEELTNYATPYLAVITAVCLVVITTYACYRFKSYAQPQVDESDEGEPSSEGSEGMADVEGLDGASGSTEVAPTSGSESAPEDGVEEGEPEDAGSVASSIHEASPDEASAEGENLDELTPGPEETEEQRMSAAFQLVEKAAMKAIDAKVESCRIEMFAKFAEYTKKSTEWQNTQRTLEEAERNSSSNSSKKRKNPPSLKALKKKRAQLTTEQSTLKSQIDKTEGEIQELEKRWLELSRDYQLRDSERESTKNALTTAKAMKEGPEAIEQAKQAATEAKTAKDEAKKAVDAARKALEEAQRKKVSDELELKLQTLKIENLAKEIKIETLKKRVTRLSKATKTAENANAKARESYEEAQREAKIVRNSVGALFVVLNSKTDQTVDMPEVASLLAIQSLVAVTPEIRKKSLLDVLTGRDGTPVISTLLSLLGLIAKHGVGHQAAPPSDKSSTSSIGKMAKSWLASALGNKFFGGVLNESKSQAEERRVEATNAILRMTCAYHRLRGSLDPLFHQMTGWLEALVGTIPGFWWLKKKERKDILASKTPLDPNQALSAIELDQDTELRLTYYQSLNKFFQNLFLSKDAEGEELRLLLSMLRVSDIPRIPDNSRVTDFLRRMKEDTKTWLKDFQQNTGANSSNAESPISLKVLVEEDSSGELAQQVLDTLSHRDSQYAFAVKKLLETLLLDPLEECRKCFTLSSSGTSSSSSSVPSVDKENSSSFLDTDPNKFVEARNLIAKLTAREAVTTKAYMGITATTSRLGEDDAEQQIKAQLANLLAKKLVKKGDPKGKKPEGDLETPEDVLKVLDDELTLIYRLIVQLYASFVSNGVIDGDQNPDLPLLEHLWNILALLEMLLRVARSSQEEAELGGDIVNDGLFDVSNSDKKKKLKQPDAELLNAYRDNFDPHDKASWNRLKAALTVEFLRAVDHLFEYMTKLVDGDALKDILKETPMALQVAENIRQLKAESGDSSSPASSSTS